MGVSNDPHFQRLTPPSSIGRKRTSFKAPQPTPKKEEPRNDSAHSKPPKSSQQEPPRKQRPAQPRPAPKRDVSPEPKAESKPAPKPRKKAQPKPAPKPETPKREHGGTSMPAFTARRTTVPSQNKKTARQLLSETGPAPEATPADAPIVPKDSDKSDSSDKGSSPVFPLNPLKSFFSKGAKEEETLEGRPVIIPDDRLKSTEEISTAANNGDTTASKTSQKAPESDDNDSGNSEDVRAVSVSPKPSRKQAPKPKKSAYKILTSTWTVALIAAISGLSVYGFWEYQNLEAEKLQNRAYQEAVAEGSQEATIENTMRIGLDAIDAMVTGAPGASFPGNPVLSNHTLEGWSTPGGTETSGTAEVSMCYTGDGVDDPRIARAYLTSGNADNRIPTWNIDSVAVTGESCNE